MENNLKFMKTLWIIIGLPGSGKSTLAKQISNESPEQPNIYEADMYFIDELGNYCWNPRRLAQAHAWCFNNVEAELRKGNSVIVSNTGLTKQERKPYIDLGIAYGAKIEVITCRNNFKNIHNVPEETIEKMREKFQEFTTDELK